MTIDQMNALLCGILAAFFAQYFSKLCCFLSADFSQLLVSNQHYKQGLIMIKMLFLLLSCHNLSPLSEVKFGPLNHVNLRSAHLLLVHKPKCMYSYVNLHTCSEKSTCSHINQILSGGMFEITSFTTRCHLTKNTNSCFCKQVDISVMSQQPCGK